MGEETWWNLRQPRAPFVPTLRLRAANFSHHRVPVAPSHPVRCSGSSSADRCPHCHFFASLKAEEHPATHKSQRK